jgi:LmbE family N-acetylglucosaminyl deacetylase
MAAVIPPVINGSGRSEQEWSHSSRLQSLAETSVSRLLADAQRLVIVSPHPDDEVLGCGGLIASIGVQAGGSLPVLILSASDGEAAYVEDPAWPPEKLAPVRRQELRSALVALGAASAQVVSLDLGDGALGARGPALQEALMRHVRATDLVLVTYAGDGHPDHEACSRAASAAAELRGARLMQYPIWAWHWSDPNSAPFLDDAVKLPLSDAALEMKRNAIGQFRTQTGHSDPAPAQPILPQWALARFFRTFEVFIP